MSEVQNKERAKKLLSIALDMHQAKELRIQAVRVLKAMGALDELWTVVKDVKCPFTRQSAIDCIPALPVVEDKVQTEELNDVASVPGNAENEERNVAAEINTANNSPDAPEFKNLDVSTYKTHDKVKKESSQRQLTSTETQIYTILLNKGAKTLTEIARIANLDRTETYHLLSSLQNKGAVNATFTHPIRFVAADGQT